jgi:hypothetical protein
MQAKRWQIVLIVIGLAGGGALLAYHAMSGPELALPHRVYLVDVATGQAYVADTSERTLTVPTANPETGKVSLIPVFEEEDGTWRASTRYLSALGQMEAENKVVDPETGALAAPPGRFRKLPGFE